MISIPMGWERERDILMNTDLREIHNLEEIGLHLDLLPQLADMSSFFKSRDIELSELFSDCSRHGGLL